MKATFCTYLCLIFSMTSFASSRVTSPMQGLDFVCSDGGDFISFNLKQSRIWIGKGDPQKFQRAKSASGVELTNVITNQTALGTVNFTGILEYDSLGTGLKPLHAKGTLVTRARPAQLRLQLSGPQSTETFRFSCHRF